VVVFGGGSGGPRRQPGFVVETNTGKWRKERFGGKVRAAKKKTNLGKTQTPSKSEVKVGGGKKWGRRKKAPKSDPTI